MAQKPKTNEPSKQKRAKELETFRHTFSALRKKFTLNEIVKISGIQMSNLSAYGTGAKNPGSETIKLFYIKMKAEIEKLPRPGKDSKTTEETSARSEKGSSKYRRPRRPDDVITDLVQNLLLNNNQLWANNEQSSKRFDKIVDNNVKLVDNNTILVNNNTQLISTNTQLVNKLVSRLDGNTPTE
jgi:hypothetical protein